MRRLTDKGIEASAIINMMSNFENRAKSQSQYYNFRELITTRNFDLAEAEKFVASIKYKMYSLNYLRLKLVDVFTDCC